MGFLATSRKEFQLMLMIWSEVAPTREVIECSKDACFCVCVCWKFILGTKAVSYFIGDNFGFVIILFSCISVYNGAYRRPTSDNVTRVEEKITDTRYNCCVWLKGGFKSKWEPILPRCWSFTEQRLQRKVSSFLVSSWMRMVNCISEAGKKSHQRNEISVVFLEIQGAG